MRLGWKFPLMGRYRMEDLLRDLNDEVMARFEEMNQVNLELQQQVGALETKVETLELRVEALEE